MTQLRYDYFGSMNFFFPKFFPPCFRAEGHPPPNAYYVDQVKNTLHQIESMDIPSVCEARYET